MNATVRDVLPVVGMVLVCCLGCGGDNDPARADACEVATNDGTAVRCFNPHGICYVGLDGDPECHCNGDDIEEEILLCAEAKGYRDVAPAPVAAPPVTCHRVDHEGVTVGWTTYDADATHTFWTECLACDDGSTAARTWGPQPRDGLTGSAIASGPSCDYPGEGTGDACAASARIFASSCAPRPGVVQ